MFRQSDVREGVVPNDISTAYPATASVESPSVSRFIAHVGNVVVLKEQVIS